MAKHLVDLDQASMKEKMKDVKANFVNSHDTFANDLTNITHLDMSDFFVEPQENNNALSNEKYFE